MADLLSPSAAPVQPMSQAIEEKDYRETRSSAKKRVLAPRPKPAAAVEPEAALPEDDQPKHAVDIDA
jgi:hypothetical protein